nr:hypothetical protein BaRGS_016264 [Batillaria attramentaria]
MDANYPKEHPRNLIPELCRVFYDLGWVTGTGGGISIKLNDEIFIAPSGVQKERIQPEDLFVQTINNEDLEGPPPKKKLKKSQCTPLFMNAYTMRNLCSGMCECYDYLFDIAVQMKQAGLDPQQVPKPPKGAYTTNVIS